MELKSGNHTCGLRGYGCFNRTFMELKFNNLVIKEQDGKF